MVTRLTIVLFAAILTAAAEASFRGQKHQKDIDGDRKQRELRVMQAITTKEEGEEFTDDWRVFFEERNVGVISPWHDVFLNAATDGLYNM